MVTSGAGVGAELWRVRDREDDPLLVNAVADEDGVALQGAEDRRAENAEVLVKVEVRAIEVHEHAGEMRLAPEIGDDAPDLAHVFEECIVQAHLPGLHEPAHFVFDQFLVSHAASSFRTAAAPR